MKDYNFLLGLPLFEAEAILEADNTVYNVVEYDVTKDIKDRKVKRVVRVKIKDNSLELVVSSFRGGKL